jgi:hypothetical protein
VRRLAAVGVLLVAAALPSAASADTVRTFAMGPRFSLDWVQSRSTYHDKLVAMAREGVTPHLRGGGRDLVTLPEDVGLLAAFAGERGAAARESKGLVGAIVALLGSYAPVSAYYGEQYPALTKGRSRPGSRIGPGARRVSQHAANQWRPALALSGSRALVAWEDERDGPAQAYAAAAPARRIR